MQSTASVIRTGLRRRTAVYGVWMWLFGLMLGLAPAGLAVAAPSLASLNLGAADLFSGTKVYSSRLLTGQQLVANGGSHVFRLRLTGLMAADLELLVPPKTRPIVAVESDILLYASEQTAHTDYDLAESARVGHASDIVSVPPVGDTYFARSQAAGTTGRNDRVIDLVFRRGRALCLVRVTGLNGKFTPTQVAAIGRIVDKRLRAAGF